MVVILLRTGRRVRVPNAQGIALRRGKLVCLDMEGRAIQTLDPADVQSFTTTDDPAEPHPGSGKKGGLFGRLGLKKAEPGLPPERVERLKERLRLQSEALAGDAALEFMEEDNREMRLEEWAKPPMPPSDGGMPEAGLEAAPGSLEPEADVTIERKDVDYLVSLLKEEYGDEDGGTPGQQSAAS